MKRAFVVGLAAVAGASFGLGFWLRPLVRPTHAGRAPTANAAAPGVDATTHRTLRPLRPRRVAPTPLRPARPAHELDDPRALVPRDIMLAHADVGASTELLASNLATRVLIGLATVVDGTSLRACLERNHPDLPPAVRVELDLRSRADAVELRSVHLVEPAGVADDDGCVRLRTATIAPEPRAAYMPPLLERDGTRTEELPLPADD